MLAGTMLLTGLSAPRAQGAGDYPSSPVKIIVPFAPGGATDVVTRIFADVLARRWGGKSIIIESRPGAGTVIGANAIAKAAPDGYTIGMIVGSFMTNAAISKTLPYDSEKDFTPLGLIAMQPMALVASKSFPPNNLAELIDYAKKSPQPIQFTSPGPRGSGHLAGELLKLKAGINMEHISYNGAAPAFTDVMAGRVPLIFDVWHSAKRFVASGDVKLIAGIGADRLKDQPGVPTIAETFPGFDIGASQALVGPAGMPQAIVDKLSEDIKAVITSPEFAEKTAALGIEPRPMSPDELGAWIKSEIARWRDIAAKADIKVE
ncbi:MAG: Bug family tripartite tricarboxylate transporter substrate binding protein [Xanthobacteraceae bacterium]